MQFFSINKAALFVAGLLLFVASHAFAISYTLEGCRSTLNTTPITSENLLCSDNAYTTGNLKGWAELDLVPHRVTIENKGSSPEVFVFTVGGDYLETQGGDVRGWDYISELTLNEEHSNQICKDWAYAHQDDLVVQELLITNPDLGEEGAGGVYQTIYRKISVGDANDSSSGLPGGAVCVADYVSRLAIGSSRYPGSSLQSNLWNENLESGGIGEKRVQLPDVLASTVDASLSAAQGQVYNWSIGKTAPSVLSFGDTCIEPNNNEQPIEFTVQWTRSAPAQEGNVKVTAVITASNTASRDIGINIDNTIFSGDYNVSDSCSFTLAAGTTSSNDCVLEYEIDESLIVEPLTSQAVVMYSDPIFPEAPISVGSYATAETNVVASGESLYETAVIQDDEWLTDPSGLFTYSIAYLEGETDGDFNGYILGTYTTDDINWTSTEKSQSGSVIFHKMVKLNEPAIIDATSKLSDRASLLGVGDVESGFAQTQFTADAQVALTIEKTLHDDILQGDETATFDFNVTGPNGYGDIVSITFDENSSLTQTVLISGLEPGMYHISEQESTYFSADEPNVDVNITAASCGGIAYFNNRLSGDPAIARVVKKTLPGGNASGWTMTLYKENGGVWNAVETLLSSGETDEFNTTLEELGHYKIEETMQNGWYQSSKTGPGCEFRVNYPEDIGQKFECSFENIQYATVIINKITDPVGDIETDFSFNHDLDANGTFMLKDGGQIVFNNVIPNTLAPSDVAYQVTESDPGSMYDLSAIECSDDDSIVTLGNAQASLFVNPGETLSCTFTNTKRATVDVKKLYNGSDMYDNTFSFSLHEGNFSGATLASDTTSYNDSIADFGGILLRPGNYSVCETGVPVAWSTNWSIGGVGVTATPTNQDSTGSNEDRCVEVTLDAGSHVTVQIDNIYIPGEGEQRTIGYWKNWNSCSNGRQALTAEKNGGAAEGYFLLDDVLPITLGSDSTPLIIDSCEAGVALLDKTDISRRAKKRANDAAYAMASQLVAAKANLKAGAAECGITPTITAADALLDAIGFDGTGEYLSPKSKNQAATAVQAHQLAGTLDAYNNGELCGD